MKDYYKTLGIDKSASKEDIKKAFHKLAHEHHPDKTKNDPVSSQKFKEASEAYSVLSDDNKRKQYDMFGSAGPSGFNPGAGGFRGGFGGAGFNPQDFAGFDFSGFQGGFQNGQGGVEFDLGDLFGEFFGGGRRPRRGRSITVDIEISFKESIFGVEKDITIDKERFTVKIPPGIEKGQGLRIKDKGENGQGGRGDLIVRVWVKDHPSFRKEGFNIITELSIKLTMALAGGVVELETLDGRIELKIPAGTSHGEILRVKGKGVPYETQGLWSGSGRRGDLMVVTHVVMPRKLSKEAQRLIDELKKEGL
ncbi:MAG: J domain-containing protein [Candidatus Taylorbacteria bacterium]|nr:J domain-containing protein [Candidatus Taylorbacteria bacterium]